MLAAALGSASPGISCVVADEPSSEQNQGMPLVPASLPNSEVPSALQAQQEQPELRDNTHEIEEYRVKLRALFERNLESGDLEKVVALTVGSPPPAGLPDLRVQPEAGADSDMAMQSENLKSVLTELAGSELSSLATVPTGTGSNDQAELSTAVMQTSIAPPACSPATSTAPTVADNEEKALAPLVSETLASLGTGSALSPQQRPAGRRPQSARPQSAQPRPLSALPGSSRPAHRPPRGKSAGARHVETLIGINTHLRELQQ